MLFSNNIILCNVNAVPCEWNKRSSGSNEIATQCDWIASINFTQGLGGGTSSAAGGGYKRWKEYFELTSNSLAGQFLCFSLAAKRLASKRKGFSTIYIPEKKRSAWDLILVSSLAKVLHKAYPPH